VFDMRPATVESISEIVDGLEAMRDGTHPASIYADELLDFQTQARDYRLSYTFHASKTVLATELTARVQADTAAPSTYEAERVLETLQGEQYPGVLLRSSGTSGQPCAGQYISGFAGVLGASEETLALGCSDAPIDLPGTSTTSRLEVRMPYSDVNLERVRTWVDSPPPPLRVPADEDAPATDIFDATAAPGPWSIPIPLEAAFYAAQQQKRLEVTDVVTVAEGHEVTLTVMPWDSLGGGAPELRLLFHCGDPRLLEVGSKWIAPYIFGASAWDAQQQGETGFIIPGVLIPDTIENYGALSAFTPVPLTGL